MQQVEDFRKYMHLFRLNSSDRRGEEPNATDADQPRGRLLMSSRETTAATPRSSSPILRSSSFWRARVTCT